MTKVFVYATLKQERILEEALGEDHGKKMTPARAIGFVPSTVEYEEKEWPTILQAGEHFSTGGELIDVDVDELDKLVAWERKYIPKTIATSKGPAIAFIFAINPLLHRKFG